MTGKTIAIIFIVLLIAGFFVRGPLPEILVPAEAIAHIGPFTLTNTILATWVTIIVLLLLFRAATSNMQLVPRGIQNLMEFVLESLYAFVVSVAGEHHGRRFFPLVATIFLFVITNAWLALFPGYGSIGIAEHADHGVVLSQVGPVAIIAPGAERAEPGSHPNIPPGGFVGTVVPFLRGANTDLNTTLALALVAMFFVEMWGIQAHGVLGYGNRFITLSGFKKGLVPGVGGFLLGLLETISEIVRVISLTFRLFGNMFAGEILLAVIVFLVPWALVLVFYSLELFVGFVQALVFAGLTLVFATMAVAAHGEEHEEAAHH